LPLVGNAQFASGAREHPEIVLARGLANLDLTPLISPGKLRILSMGRKAQKNDSLPGSLDMLILRTLSRRDLHGYGIVQSIQQSSNNELIIEEGSLYPALQRLELNGWINGVWGVTSNNRRARIYKITAAGRKQLAVETRQYAKLTLAIARVMGAE
jgi:PadR family transcriptional regulator PadR